jgi:nitroimidazol reductase NimA-like FMN-containing flavoprotein (pyridoxamine 5'-phosphate oxidase superfamily)
MRRKDREVTSHLEIESIILKSDVCRIALADGDFPYIVTLNFGYTGENEKVLYFHCANEGRKLDMIRKNNLVCFEMDTDHLLVEGNLACDFTMNYKSVLGYGLIRIVTEYEEKVRGFNAIMSHYKPGVKFSFNERMFENTTILRCDITGISAKMC